MDETKIPPQVKQLIDSYPDDIKKQIYRLRQLVFEVAAKEGINDLEETLKWGEPSYVTKQGSTLRIAWRKKSPEQYGLFFNCKTTLIETIRELYGERFCYESNRAIIFMLDEKIPTEIIKQCILLSLTYHTRKHLPMLGC